jgi:PAS domain S-box-containing protein
LILHRGIEHRIEAEAITSGETIIVRLGAASVAEATVPESIVNHVTRTQESVILDDALVQNPFSTDDYIRQQQARSVLCLPLIKQARLIGVLYLENNLAPHVFTPARIAVLKLLASQAAISLENTYLYRDLEEREARIRRLLDANIVGIFIWNLDGKIIEANEAFLKIVEYSRQDVAAGRVRWRDLTPAEWRDRDERAVAEVKATGTVQPSEKEYFRKDGSRVPVLVGAAMFEGSRNEGVAFVLDLSKQKRAEEAFQKAQTALAHVARVATMGELTASIAHEINQPLGAIANNAQAGLRFLATGSENLQDVKEALSDILKGAERLNGIIVRMRALAKKAPPEMVQLNFKDVVADVLTCIHHELTRRHVEIEFDLSRELPPVLADRVQLQQVLLNLVMNGVEAMNEVPEGSRKIWVRAKPYAHNGSSAVLVSVQDSGSGLKQVDVDRLFEAFYTTKSQGLGMGLAISRSIVEAHGGRLWLASTGGPGATFQFVLPATG